MIGFYLKKGISFFIEPYGFLLTLFLLAFYFLLKKHYKLVKIFLSIAIGFYFLFAYPPFSNVLVSNLEEKYSKYNYDKNITYIHVLGSGNSDDFSQPISSMLGDSALKRVVEGVVIYKKQPNLKLIFTGYACCSSLSTAKANAMLAMELGVSQKDIIINETPKDTKEEALFAKKFIGKNSFILVTSALHMPRAMLLFHKEGLYPIPAPSDFEKIKIDSYFYVPSVVYFNNSQKAIHEYIGILWETIKN